MKLPLLQPHLRKASPSPRNTDERIQKEALKLKAFEEKLRQREAQLKEREKFTEQKEQFLNQKEDELLNRERDLITQCDERVAELNEKEKLLNEILRRQNLPLIKGDLKRALQAIEQSQGSTATGASVRGSFS